MAFKSLLKLLAIPLAVGCCAPVTRISRFHDLRVVQEKDYSEECKPGKDTLETAISKIWNSRFFRDDPKVLMEILDNGYEVYELPKGIIPRLQGYYLREDSNGNPIEDICINSILFCRPENKSSFYRDLFIVLPLRQVLVHEIFHDLWNNLLSDEEKSSFTEDMKMLYYQVKEANDSGKIDEFMKMLGHESFDDEIFYDMYWNNVHKIDLYLELEGEKTSFGTEAYSIVADRDYAFGFGIPKPLQKYYRMFLSEDALERGKSGFLERF